MIKRPLSITLIGWLFVVFGCVSLAAVLLPLAIAAASGAFSEFEGPLLERPTELVADHQVRVTVAVPV